MYREIKEEELRTHKTLGYVYFQDRSHPLATNSGFVYYHRHVSSIKEGRWLTTDEHVHHIDENKKNNSPLNLILLSNSEHNKLHKNSTCLEIICPTCNSIFTQKDANQQYCSITCYNKSIIQLDGLTKEELEYLIWTQPFTKLALQFNCSDNGIRRWAKRLGCSFPPSRFHVKGFSLETKEKLYFDTISISTKAINATN